MAVGFNNTTDLYEIYNVISNVMIRYPKEAIIFSLRSIFEQDSYFHFTNDQWGYPYTPDQTDLSPEAGVFDDGTTRIFLGEANRGDVIFYPAVLVKAGSFKYVPISLNRDQCVTKYETVVYTDGYTERRVQTPVAFALAGAWDGQIIIEVITRSVRSRDDLVQIISLAFTDWKWNDLFRSGISIKPTVSTGTPSETDDRNDKLYRQTITLEIRTEWHREIPISNTVDAINICVDFGVIDGDDFVVAPNMTINTSLSLLDAFQPT